MSLQAKPLQAAFAALALMLAACGEKSDQIAARPDASPQPVRVSSGEPPLVTITPAPAKAVAKAPAKADAATSAAHTAAAAPGPEETASWEAVQKLSQMPDYFKPGQRPSADDLAKAMAQERERLGKVIDALEDFRKRYPQSPRSQDALDSLVTAATSLQRVSPDGSERARQAIAEIKSAPGLPAQTALMLTIGGISAEIQGTTDTQKLSAAMEKAEAEAADFAKKYPGTTESKQLYAALGQAIPRLAPKRAKPFFETLAKSGDPQLEEMAKSELQQLEMLGTAPQIRFAALDGKEVDLAKMKGKVVLVDFWATWCGPCVANLPEVLDAYKKHHDKGFEIVGISLDESKGALQDFIKQRGMDWPEYYDGKRWQNAFAVRFGIRAIPAQWLIDKSGKLVDLNAATGLDEKIAALLADKKID